MRYSWWRCVVGQYQVEFQFEQWWWCVPNYDHGPNRYTDQVKIRVLGQAGLAINRLPPAVCPTLGRRINWYTPCDTYAWQEITASKWSEAYPSRNESRWWWKPVVTRVGIGLSFIRPFTAPASHSPDLSRTQPYSNAGKLTAVTKSEIHMSFVCNCIFSMHPSCRI